MVSSFIQQETIVALSDPGKTRTCDPLLRRQMLYPLSYGADFILKEPLPDHAGGLQR